MGTFLFNYVMFRSAGWHLKREVRGPCPDTDSTFRLVISILFAWLIKSEACGSP